MACRWALAMLLAAAGPAAAENAAAEHAGAGQAAPGDPQAAAHAPADAHAHTVWGKPLDPSPLAIDGKLFFMTLALFLGLLYFTTKEVWRPLLSSMQDRERRIAESLRGAEIAQAEAAKLLARQEQELGAAHAEVRKLVDQARADAQRAADELLAEAKARTAAERARFLAELEGAKRSALAEIDGSSADLAARIASRVLNRSVGADTVRQAAKGQS